MEKFIDALHINPIVASYMKKVDYKYFTSNPYIDQPKNIYKNMTISAPHMHALALDVLKPWNCPIKKEGCCNILDVGCGSGYLTAVFAISVLEKKYKKIYGIDNKPELVEISINNINNYNKSLIDNDIINISIGDGWLGITNIRFDIIHVGACASTIPYTLLKQLKIGGRMFLPLIVGETQQAFLITRKSKKN